MICSYYTLVIIRWKTDGFLASYDMIFINWFLISNLYKNHKYIWLKITFHLFQKFVTKSSQNF